MKILITITTVRSSTGKSPETFRMSFYSRYIPPSKVPVEVEVPHHLAKRRKLEPHTRDSPSRKGGRQPAVAENLDDDVEIPSPNINAGVANRHENVHEDRQRQLGLITDAQGKKHKGKKARLDHAPEDSGASNRSALARDAVLKENGTHPVVDVEPAEDPVLPDDGLGRSRRQKDRKRVKKQKDADNETDDPEKPESADERGKHKSIFSKFALATSATKSDSDAHINGHVNKDDQPEDPQADQMLDFHGLEPLPQPAHAPKAPKVSIAAALPLWIREPTVVSKGTKTPFIILNVQKNTLKHLARKSITEALPIQSGVIPLLHGDAKYGGDLCISAATGSGKTLAYAIPMVEALRDKYGHKLRGLVVVPTRELVAQAKDTLDLLTAGTDLRVATSVGNQALRIESEAFVSRKQRYDPEARLAERNKVIDRDEQLMDWDFDAMLSLSNDEEDRFPDHIYEYHSQIDILVCTPGRLVEHLKSTKGFNLHDVQWLIIDEADRLLDDSFQEWIDTVIPELEYMRPLNAVEQRFARCTPLLRRREVTKVVLSATMTRDVGKLGGLKLKRPKMVVLEGTEAEDGEDLNGLELPATLREYAVMIEDVETKPLALLKILETPLPEPLSAPTKQDTVDAMDVDAPAPNGGSSTAPTADQDSDATSSDSDSDSDSDSITSSSEDESTTSTTHISNSKPRHRTSTTHSTLIFTSSTSSTHRLAQLLSLLRPSLAPLISTLTKSTSPAHIARTLRSFAHGSTHILIATDRASRGLDLPDLKKVVNYDVPSSVGGYVHRVGRTARAGKEGVAVSMVEGRQGKWFWDVIARGGEGWDDTGGVKGGDGEGRIVRREGSGVRRWNLDCKFEGVEREGYKRALEELGRKVKGDD